MPSLPWRHLLLAFGVVAIWGSNFAVIKIALGHLPPLLFATLRFSLATVPAIFFLPRPAVPWRHLAAYGILIGVGQFGFVYFAMTRFISPGLASLVVQTQVFFTIGLAMWWQGERLRRHQPFALALAAAGLGVIIAHTDAHTTPLGLVMILLAALNWSLANQVARASPKANMLAYVVWSSPFAVPPLLGLSLWADGPERILDSLRDAGWSAWGAVLWQSVANTLFGYAAWGWLLARHPATTVMPIALLVPVFGMGASTLWLGEPLPPWKLLAGGLVMAGLAVNLLWPTGSRAAPKA